MKRNRQSRVHPKNNERCRLKITLFFAEGVNFNRIALGYRPRNDDWDGRDAGTKSYA